MTGVLLEGLASLLAAVSTVAGMSVVAGLFFGCADGREDEPAPGATASSRWVVKAEALSFTFLAQLFEAGLVMGIFTLAQRADFLRS